MKRNNSLKLISVFLVLTMMVGTVGIFAVSADGGTPGGSPAPTVTYAATSADLAGVTYADTWDGTADTAWYTTAEPGTTTFEIDTAEKLAGLAALVDDQANAGSNFAGMTVKVAANLDMAKPDGTANEWTSIGSGAGTAFNGTLEGKDGMVYIKNVTINSTATVNGFITCQKGGGVKNLTLVDPVLNISGDITNNGILIGAINGDNVTLQNVGVVNGNINVAAGTTKANGIGGLVGLVNKDTATLTNCDADVTFNLKEDVSNEVLGGVFGAIRQAATVTDCDANVTVVANDGQTPPVYYTATALGGVTGEVKADITFAECDVKLNGTLKGTTATKVAGIYGSITQSADPVININTCSVSGEITFEGDVADIGGFGSLLQKTGVVSNSKSALAININGNAANVGGMFATVTGARVETAPGSEEYNYTTVTNSEAAGAIRVTGTATNVGAVAGTASLQALITGVKVTEAASIAVTGTATNVGGVAGSMSDSASVIGSEVAGEVAVLAANSTAIGGVAGRVSGTATVSNTAVTATVGAMGRDSHGIGGVIGLVSGGIQVTNTNVSGVIAAGKHTYATGGVIGEITGSDPVTISNSVFSGGLTSSGHTAGGLVGSTDTTLNIQLSRVTGATITVTGLKYTLTPGISGEYTTYTAGNNAEKNVGGLVGVANAKISVQGTEVIGTTINATVNSDSLKYDSKIDSQGNAVEQKYLQLATFKNAETLGLTARVGGMIGYNNHADTCIDQYVPLAGGDNVSNRVQVTINTGMEAHYTAGVVGLSNTKLTVKDTAVDATMTFNTGSKHIGGITGKASTLVAENLTVRLSIDEPDLIFGYLTGVHGWWASTSSVYSNCNIIMDVTVNTNGGEVGIAGLLPGMNNPATIDNCAVAGQMTFMGTGAYRSGGLLGGINACTQTVSNCVVNVDMVHANVGSANPNLHMGGIAGEIRNVAGNLTLNNCYYGGHIIAETGKRAGGIVGFVAGTLTMNNVQMDGVVSVNSTQNGAFVGRLDIMDVTANGTPHQVTFNNCLLSGISKNGAGLENGVSWIGLVGNNTATTYTNAIYEVVGTMDWVNQDGVWVKTGNDDLSTNTTLTDALISKRLDLTFNNCYSTYAVSFAPQNDLNSNADTIAINSLSEELYSVNGTNQEHQSVNLVVNNEVKHSATEGISSANAYMAIKCEVVPQATAEIPAEGDQPAVPAVSAKEAMIADMNYTYTPAATPSNPEPQPVTVTFDFVGEPGVSDPVWTIVEGAVYPILTGVVKKDNIGGIKLYNETLLCTDMTWFNPNTVNYTVNSDAMMAGMARFSYGMALTKVYKFELQVNQITSVDLSLYADGYIASIAPQLLLLTVHYQFNADKTQIRLISTLASNQYASAKFEFLRNGKKIIASARPPETDTVYTSIQGGGNTYTADDFSAAGTCIFVSTMNVSELGLQPDDVITIQATYVTLKGISIKGLAYTATYAEMLAACGM